jgi:non-specific serine/threonine protein kinase
MTDRLPIDLGIEGLTDPEEVGVGGFATVYKAYQPAFRRTVAVKVLATLNLDDAARERFERECQAMGSLSEHPNIVTVYGAGFTTSGRPYLVMAFLPGGSLQERLERDGPVPWQDATLYGVHLAGALETAHRAGVVHRDIKPGNVLRSSYGDAQLTDFGIARISGGHETRSGVITASMAHAPPEVLDGQRPTVSADVYSLGSTLFELMYGRPAFQAEDDESMVPMLRRILTQAPPDLRPLGVPDAVCEVIERSMAKDPTQRPSSAAQLGQELQAARRGLGLESGKLTVPAEVSIDPVADSQAIHLVSSTTGPAPASVTTVGVAPGAIPPPPVPPTYPGDAAAAPAEVAAPSTGEPRGRGRLALVVGLVLLLVLGAAIGGFVLVSGGDDEELSDPPVTEVAPTSDPPSTDETTDPGAGYTIEVERNFVDVCLQNPDFTRAFCRCVFKGIRDTVPFERFRELEAMSRSGESLEGTELDAIVDGCVQ